MLRILETRVWKINHWFKCSHWIMMKAHANFSLRFWGVNEFKQSLCVRMLEFYPWKQHIPGTIYLVFFVERFWNICMHNVSWKNIQQLTQGITPPTLPMHIGGLFAESRRRSDWYICTLHLNFRCFVKFGTIQILMYCAKPCPQVWEGG